MSSTPFLYLMAEILLGAKLMEDFYVVLPQNDLHHNKRGKGLLVMSLIVYLLDDTLKVKVRCQYKGLYLQSAAKGNYPQVWSRECPRNLCVCL